MAQQGNDILKQILGVCVQINKKLDKTGGSDKGTGSIFGVFGKSEKKAKTGANIINSIMGSLTQFVKLTPSSKKIDRTSKAIKGLFETVFWVAEKEKAAKKFINIVERMAKSLKSIEGISKGLGMFMLGLGGAFVLLAGGIVLAGKLLGTTGVLATLGVVTLIVATTTLMIYTLSRLNKQVDQGSKTAKKMGTAMMYLAGGVVVMALGVVAVGKILGFGGGKTAIIGVLGIIGIIGVFATAFSILGMFEGLIKKGAGVAGIMAIGMAALALGTFVLAKAAQAITNIGAGGEAVNKKGEKRGKFGQLMSEIGPGLGVIGILLVSSALLFSALGAFAPLIIAGAVTSMVMSGALILMAKSTKKVMEIASGLETDKIRGTITDMVTGTMGGLIDGVSQTLSGGEKGIKGFAEGIKNTAILTAGIGLLMGVSVSLSMFAKAITAFANLDNMRVIESYDEKTGEPKFGDTVNIKGVGETVKETLVTFLTGLLDATVGLTKRKASAIKKMGRALTGRRGILSAIIQFADVLKTFAQFGPNGEIGFVDLVETGTDEDGFPIYEKKQSKVKIETVVGNIGSSFNKFVTELAELSKNFEFGGKEKRKLGRLSKALTGRRGILEPIISFTKAIEAYAQYGEEGKIVTYKTDAEGNTMVDSKGNPIVLNTSSIQDIAKNTATTITSFATHLSRELENVDKKSGKKAGKQLKGFESMIKQIGNLSKNTRGIDATAKSLDNLATSMTALVKSINELNVDKLGALAKITKDKKVFGASESKTTRNDTSSIVESSSKSNEELIKLLQTLNTKLDDLPTRVGMAASSSLNDKQFTFEFQGDNKGVLNVG